MLLLYSRTVHFSKDVFSKGCFSFPFVFPGTLFFFLSTIRTRVQYNFLLAERISPFTAYVQISGTVLYDRGTDDPVEKYSE